MTTETQKAAHAHATWRHDKNDPNKWITKIPIEVVMGPSVNNEPRIAGSLFENCSIFILTINIREYFSIFYLVSLRYTTIGASFNPPAKLNKVIPMQTIVNEFAKTNKTNPVIAGIVATIIALRRPIASETKPLSTLPNGWPMNAKLAVQLISFYLQICLGKRTEN